MVGISSSWQSNAQGTIGFNLLLYLFSFIEGWRAGCSSGASSIHWKSWQLLKHTISFVPSPSWSYMNATGDFPSSFFTTLNMKAQGLHANPQLLQPRGCLLDQGLHSKPHRHRINSTFILTWPLPKNNTLRRQTQKSFPRQIRVNRFLTFWKPGASV